MRLLSSSSRIKNFENGIDEVLKVWRLNTQSGKQEFVKIGQKCFRWGLKKFSNWNARNSRIGIKKIWNYYKKLTKWDNEVLEVKKKKTKNKKKVMKLDWWSSKRLKIKLSKWDSRNSENFTKMLWKRVWEAVKVEYKKMENCDPGELILPKRRSQNEIIKF